MREREKGNERGQEEKQADNDSDAGGQSLEQQRAAKLQQARATRNALKGQAGKAAQAMSQGANLFQMAVRGLGEDELKKKLEPAVAEKVKDALIDKVSEKFKEGVIEVSDLGKEVASKSSAVFGAIKSNLSERIKAQKELSVLEAADMVTAAIIEQSITMEKHLGEVIDNLPREKVLAVRKVLAQFNGIKDEDDSPETGNLEDGMKAWAMTDLIGLPSGDGVAIEGYARAAFASFQEAVRSTMTAGEAGDAIQHRLANPNEDQEKIEGAEEKMGPQFKAGIQKDKNLRGRVAATGGDQ